MRGFLWCAALVLSATRVMAQPADCTTRPAPVPSQFLGIDLKGQSGVPAGVTGKAFIAVPLQLPSIDCGEPSAPVDVLGGAPGDLLRGTPPAAPERR
jgi:hypothetical protein